MGAMTPGTEGFVPDPEDWPKQDQGYRSPEALENEKDDLAAALAPTSDLTEADEADVMEQLRDAGSDEDER